MAERLGLSERLQKNGEWWFNVFENGQLEIRAVRQGKIKHMSTVSAHDLGQWALELEDIADVLDDIEFYCRRLKQQTRDDPPFAE